jgi:hypothetical protein
VPIGRGPRFESGFRLVPGCLKVLDARLRARDVALSAKVFVSTTIVLNVERSPSFDGLAASAEATMAMSLSNGTPVATNGATRIIVDRTIPWTLRIDIDGLLCCGSSARNCS